MTEGRNITAKTMARPPRHPVNAKVPFAFVHINKCGGSSVEIALGLQKMHLTAAEQRATVGAEQWDNAYTFALVRNPFARVASIYYYRVKTDQGGLADRHLSINAWVEQVWGSPTDTSGDESILLRPAWDWVSQDGRALVTETPKLEDVEAEWPRICARLGVDRELSLTNQNFYPPYRYVLGREARAAIEGAFAEDLNRFGYDW
ncbi:MAG: hypothetical protein AAGJ28_13035 [Pseudomonadota bacterium]